MDYEKAYKTSLKTAAQWIKDGCTDKEKICLKCVFPELRESEDERIRKLLVWQVYRNIEDETNDLAQSVYDGIKGHDPDIEESIEDWKKCLAYLEKQKEPHYTKRNALFDKCVAECDPAIMKEVSDKIDEMLEKEQKSIQTSEEKEYIRTLKSLISDFIRDKQPEDVIYYQRVYDWLDGRHIEQKPAEWSEEAEMYLSQAIETLEHENYSILADKLKSLRPKPNTVSVENATKFGNLEYERGVKDGIQSEKSRQWKPSEEQMEVDLEKEIDNVIADYSFVKTIDSGGFKTTVLDYAKIARHFYEIGKNNK